MPEFLGAVKVDNKQSKQKSIAENHPEMRYNLNNTFVPKKHECQPTNANTSTKIASLVCLLHLRPPAAEGGNSSGAYTLDDESSPDAQLGILKGDGGLRWDEHHRQGCGFVGRAPNFRESWGGVRRS